MREPLHLHAPGDVHRAATRERSFRPRSTSITCSARSFSEEAFDVTLRRLGRARDGAEARSPVLARDQALRDEPTSAIPLSSRRKRYGDGLTRRSARYTSSGDAAVGRCPLRRHALEHVAGHVAGVTSAPSPRTARGRDGARGCPRCRASRDATGSRPRTVPRPPPRRPRAPRPCRRRDRSARGSPRRRAGCRRKPCPSSGSSTVGSRTAMWS